MRTIADMHDDLILFGLGRYIEMYADVKAMHGVDITPTVHGILMHRMNLFNLVFSRLKTGKPFRNSA